MNVATLSGVSKAFGPRAVLTDVELAIEPGSVVAVVGHNGSGKSTLIRTIATVLLPDAGRIEIAGVDALSDPLAARRHVGLTLAEDRAWYWRLTGAENMEFFAALHGLRPRAARQRTLALLEAVGLAESAGQAFGEYSSGMRLRLSFARALIGAPRLLLLDEPTRSIDPEGASAFRALIREHVRATGAAALIASHDANEVSQLADTVLHMRVGEAPREFAPAPSAETLARILGVAD